MEDIEFRGFPKIARLSREIIITEKIDGTNAQIYIGSNGEVLVGSRKRWITPESDNFGFAKWANMHKEELLMLGPGQHFGEWWGEGIQRGYDIAERRFSLFNVQWHNGAIPSCCRVVPILYQGIFDTHHIQETLDKLRDLGSKAAPGFMRPEGIIIFHKASGTLFKKTIENDEKPKGSNE